MKTKTRTTPQRSIRSARTAATRTVIATAIAASVPLLGAGRAQAQSGLNPEILRAELTRLQVQRLRLLQNNKANSLPLKSINGQINGVRQLLAQLPDTGGTLDNAGNTAGQVTGQAPGVFNGANQTLGQVGNSANGALGQVGNTAGQVTDGLGNTTGGLVGGLQPTLQPVTQGVGGALNNLTSPDTISSLLEFLAGVIPNHIEAHVNLDSLRVEKLTVDIRGVDLRNLRVDLLVANSRNAGQVRPALQTGRPGGANSGTGSFGGTGSGATGGYRLPGNTPITGSSTRGR